MRDNPPDTNESVRTPVARTTMQHLMGNLLRVGVSVSAIIVCWGGFHYLMESGNQLPAFTTFAGEPVWLTDIPQIFRKALQGNNQAIIQTGLLVLIFTPVARVIASVLIFALEKDWLYVGITLVVLSILSYGLLGGAAL